MRRTLLILSAVAIFAVLVHTVLLVAHVSEPAETTVQGLTPRRLWATTSALLALAGVISGAFALKRPSSALGAAGAMLAGLIAGISGALNLALATGGPGTGNGVVGGAAAFVLALVAMTLGGLGLARGRQSTRAEHS